MGISGRVDKRGAGGLQSGRKQEPFGGGEGARTRLDKKSRISSQGRISLHGRVSQVAYYGDTSHIFVALDSGGTLSVIFQNEARSAEPAVRIGQELWCSWDPRDTLILGN